jgi:hypothetical protein
MIGDIWPSVTFDISDCPREFINEEKFWYNLVFMIVSWDCDNVLCTLCCISLPTCWKNLLPPCSEFKRKSNSELMTMATRTKLESTFA